MQAQKRTRILEQQEANEKKNKALEELEKSGTLNEEMKEFIEGSVKTNFAKTDATTASTAKTQKKLSENVDLKDLNNDQHSIEESQVHLKPSVVDTSLVKGQITQVC